MKAFLDSSVVIAALVAHRPHHASDEALINDLIARREQVYMSAHGIAEVYSVLTRAPLPLRIYPHET